MLRRLIILLLLIGYSFLTGQINVDYIKYYGKNIMIYIRGK